MQMHHHPLAAGQTRALDVTARTELHVLCGVIWLTQSGDANDYFVRAGQFMALAGTRAVVQAEGGRSAAYRLQKSNKFPERHEAFLHPQTVRPRPAS